MILKIDFANLKDLIYSNDAPGIPESGRYRPACVFHLLFDFDNHHILTIQQTKSNRDIEVFTGLWNGVGPVGHDPAEIARVLEIPLQVLVQTHIAEGFHNRVPDVQELRYPFEDVVVWGATARIFHHFIELLYPVLK